MSFLVLFIVLAALQELICMISAHLARLPHRFFGGYTPGSRPVAVQALVAGSGAIAMFVMAVLCLAAVFALGGTVIFGDEQTYESIQIERQSFWSACANAMLAVWEGIKALASVVGGVYASFFSFDLERMEAQFAGFPVSVMFPGPNMVSSLNTIGTALMLCFALSLLPLPGVDMWRVLRTVAEAAFRRSIPENVIVGLAVALWTPLIFVLMVGIVR